MKSANWFWLACAPAAFFFLSGCGGGTGTVNLAIKVSGGSSRALPAELLADSRSAQTTAMSFTPTSFKLPIMKITVAKADGSDEKIIYSCSHTAEADCLVDLQSQTALDAISAAARGVSIDADTYDHVSLYTCADGSNGMTSTTAKITGTGTAPGGAGSWRTDATTNVDTSGTGTPSETSVGNWSCATKNVKIPGGIVVGATALTLTVVVDNYLSALFRTDTSGGMGGCKVADGTSSGNGFCVTYPALMAYLGTDTPTTRRFSISHDSIGAAVDSKANALIIVALSGTGTPLMAYGRTLYRSGSEVCAANTYASSILAAGFSTQYGGPTYVTETNSDTFTVNADGTIAFTQGGSADTYAAKFSAFNATATHTGTVKSRDDAYTWNYKATLIP